MSQIASPAQLRMSLLRWALFVIPSVMLLGFLSGTLSGSGEENGWYAQLVKPEIQPPGWLFGLVWTALYFLTGLALALVLNARGAPLRMMAVGLFLLQFAMNLAWSPMFFGQHKVTAAIYLIVAILLVAIITTYAFARIRKAAAWLMLPYLGWLCFAAWLNFAIHRLNPDAEILYVPSVTSDIGG